MNSENRVVLLEEIFPGDTNPYGTAFGGKILALMDRAAALAASRFGRQHFVTASMTDVFFRKPVRQGEIVEVAAQVAYTTKHTYGLVVEVSAMGKTDWRRRPCGGGIIFMVARGPDDRLLELPQLKPTTGRAKKLWRQLEKIHLRLRQGSI